MRNHIFGFYNLNFPHLVLHEILNVVVYFFRAFDLKLTLMMLTSVETIISIFSTGLTAQDQTGRLDLPELEATQYTEREEQTRQSMEQNILLHLPPPTP